MTHPDAPHLNAAHRDAPRHRRSCPREKKHRDTFRASNLESYKKNRAENCYCCRFCRVLPFCHFCRSSESYRVCRSFDSCRVLPLFTALRSTDSCRLSPTPAACTGFCFSSSRPTLPLWAFTVL
uniref:Uncharacterized protein n=1 Tax=Knipowitschia caucasica TaxID=637954 RepID=A0AAV2KTY4_KNICA